MRQRGEVVVMVRVRAVVAAASALGCVAVSVAVPAAGVSAATPARAVTSDLRAAIAFVRYDDRAGEEDNEIWTMDRLGGSQRRLTDNARHDLDPEWSPDGSRVLWVQYEGDHSFGPTDLWVMDADGTDKQQLTHDLSEVSHPTWSPDGSQIAFARDYRIWVMDADGTDQRPLTTSDEFSFDPAWSPDGSRILFVRASDVPWDLWTMRPDGSARRRMTFSPAIRERDPAWSPDGERIAFSAYSDRTSWNVWLMRSDRPGQHIAVDTYSLQPTWVPNNRSLVFYACSNLGGCDLHRSGLDGANLRRLSTRLPVASDVQPDYRPPSAPVS